LLLERRELFVAALTERLLTYALGRTLEPYDMPTVRKIVSDSKKHNYKMSSFIMGVVSSPAFQMSRAEAVETTEANR